MKSTSQSDSTNQPAAELAGHWLPAQRSSQVNAEREYVARVFEHLAGHVADDGAPSSVILGYN